MSRVPLMLLVVGPRRPRAAGPVGVPMAPVLADVSGRAWRHQDLVLIDQLDAGGLIGTLERVLRHDGLAAGLFLRPPPSPAFASTRLIEQARRPTWGFAVRQDRSDPRVPLIGGLLAPYAALLRQRSPSGWRALDAVRLHGSASGAAEQLGCTPQAVRKNLRVAHHRATADLPALLTHLLHPAPDPAGPAALCRPVSF